MTTTLPSGNDQATRTGDQAMAVYQRWRLRMIRRTSHPALPTQKSDEESGPDSPREYLASDDDLHS